MSESEKIYQNIIGFLKGTVHTRKTKARKMPVHEGEEVESYRTYYVTIHPGDVKAFSLQEGDRVSLGLIKVEKK